MRCHSSNQKEMQRNKNWNEKYLNGFLNRLDTVEEKNLGAKEYINKSSNEKVESKC